MLIQYLLKSSEVYNTGSEPRPWIFQDANFSVPTDHLNLKKDTLLREVTGRELKTMKVCLKKQNKTTVWTELKDDWSAETVPVSAAVTTRRRIDFAPLPLADTDMQMLLLCDTTHRLRTDANKQPLKTNHNPKEWRVILLFFFFPPRAQKIWNIPLWLMHHLQPVLRLSSLQCEITTPAMSPHRRPPPPKYSFSLLSESWV